MALIDSATLAKDTTFREKVRVAAVKASISIVGEAQSADNRRTEKRHALGVAVLSDGGLSKLDSFAWAVASLTGISGSSTDTELENAVASIFGDLAGVSNSEGG
jgi:hypothetical protein